MTTEVKSLILAQRSSVRRNKQEVADHGYLCKKEGRNALAREFSTLPGAHVFALTGYGHSVNLRAVCLVIGQFLQ